MRLPTPLSRRNPDVHKNQFGHVLIVAGSGRMLGAAALCALSAMRSGAGLTTVGIPKSLNKTLQSKLSNVVMTLPLPQTSTDTVASGAYAVVKKLFDKYQAVAVGPGLGLETGTRSFVLRLIKECPLPVVVDADALNGLASDVTVLNKAQGPRILTPHPGEMARLCGLPAVQIEKNRLQVASDFAVRQRCVVILKGHRTCVASPIGKTYINKTGNSGMATAGSGDVLTGMIVAFLAQGIGPFESAKIGCYLHGLAGDLAARRKGKVSLIASDLIDAIPEILKRK